MGIRNNYMLYSLKRGIINLIRWFPIVWRDEDWDWAFLAEIMEFKFRNMSRCFKHCGHSVDSERQARNTLICAELLKRLREDGFGESSSITYRLHESRMKGWQEMLGRYIGKYLRNWWD